MGQLTSLRRGSATVVTAPLVAAALAGCDATTPKSATAAPTPTTKAARSQTPSTGVTAAAVNVEVYPSLLDPQKMLLQRAGQSGSATLGTIPVAEQGTLELRVACSGNGSIKLNVDPVIDFTIPCGKAQFNEIGLRSTYKDLKVSVTSSTTGKWALSVGWTKVLPSEGSG